MSLQLPLTQQPKGYDGNHKRMEIIPFSKGIHEEPGVYLQEVEGCGYTVYHLTPIEALALAGYLIQAANETVAEFRN